MLLNWFRTGFVKDSFECYEMARDGQRKKGFGKMRAELKWWGGGVNFE